MYRFPWHRFPYCLDIGQIGNQNPVDLSTFYLKRRILFMNLIADHARFLTTSETVAKVMSYALISTWLEAFDW